MNKNDETEVQQILELQEQISKRLTEFSFVDDAAAAGNIIHHLAELSIWGKKLSQEALPSLLTLPLENREDLADLIVDMNYNLTEMKEAIEDMEPAFLQLMNLLTQTPK